MGRKDSANQSKWLDDLMNAVADLGEEGRISVEFLRTHGTKIGFMKVRRNIGAFWTLFGNIRLNSRYYNYDTPLDDLKLRTLIIHEAYHLQQGFFKAFSVYGELEAWQLEFGIAHRFTGKYPRKAIADLMQLPLKYDRVVLKRAVELMQEYAGKGYHADLLPLYPLGREFKHWLSILGNPFGDKPSP